MSESDAQTYVGRAIELAMRGRGFVEPNPMVGCVLVKDGAVIGEGFHAMFGGPHAEPSALADCRARGIDPRGATAYVTLEPCCHLTKKTPPCAPRLIEEGIAKVVIGTRDPNPQVDGRGIATLREAGIEVVEGVLRDPCMQLIAPFVARTQIGRPYVTLKWAQTADGAVAGSCGAPMRISNATSWGIVHALRTRSDAIVVGVNTVISDDPLLTVRGVERMRTPIRVVLDSRGRTPASARLLADDSARNLVLGPIGLEQAMYQLAADHQAAHVLVEPGPTLARAFVDANLADRIWVIGSPLRLDQADAPRAIEVPYPPVAQANVEGDTITEYLNPRSPVYFAAAPSADFLALVARRPPQAR